MNKKLQIIGVIFLAFIFTIGISFIMPKVNAEENTLNTSVTISTVDPIIIIDPVDDYCYIMDDTGARTQIPCPGPDPIIDPVICPAVCVPMWVLGGDYSCSFTNCGSGCGVDNVNTFNTREECVKNAKEKPPMPPAIEKKLGLQVRFTPLIDTQTNSGYIYDFSKIHIRIVSTQEINISELVLKARMTEIQNNVDTIKEVNLIITELNAPQIIETVSNENKSVEEKINQARNQIKENNGVGPSIISNRKVFVYNYMVSFSENTNQIASVYGKDYKSKAYNIDITLQNKRDQTIVDSKRHEVKYGLENIKEKIEEIKIHQDQVKILREEVKAEVSQAIEKARGESVLVRPLDDSEIFSNEDLTEMYVSNNLGIRKIRPINDVLISNKIKPEHVIGNVELISVNENVEYLVKIKEKRKLLGFIPFGNREKYLSLNASEDIEITE